MPRSYSPPEMARRANNSSSGGQSSIILRASEPERCSARWRGHPSTPAVLQPSSSSRPEPPVSLDLAWCHQISPPPEKKTWLNINISADAGELSALIVRCVDAPADSLRCVALEMRRGGGEKQEEEEREAGGEDVAYLRGSATMPI